MTSREKKKSATTQKSRTGARLQTQRKFEGASKNLGLLTASETFDGDSDFVADVIEETFDRTDHSAVLDLIQMQVDSQLQNELDFYVEEHHSLTGQADELYDEHETSGRYRLPSSKSSLFDLPKESNGAMEKSIKKPKRHTEDLSTTHSSKLQKSKKKKRKVKSSSHDQEIH